MALLLSGCALAPFDEDSFFRKTTTTVGVTGQLAEPKDFVRESRTGSEEYPPVGVTPPAPAIPVRQGPSVSALENELNALKQRNEQAVAAPRPPSPYDGKIEPGYKAPPPPPPPAYTGPKVDLPAAAAQAQPSQSPAKSTNRKPKDKKASARSSSPGT